MSCRTPAAASTTPVRDAGGQETRRGGPARARAGCLLAAWLLLAGHPVRAGQDPPPRTGTGGLLQQRCRLYFEFLGRTGAGREDTFNQDPFGMGYCAGLVRGVVIATPALMPGRVCVPPGTTVAEVVRRVVLYIDDHPRERGEQDVELVLRTLEDRFRCP